MFFNKDEMNEEWRFIQLEIDMLGSLIPLKPNSTYFTNV